MRLASYACGLLLVCLLAACEDGGTVSNSTAVQNGDSPEGAATEDLLATALAEQASPSPVFTEAASATPSATATASYTPSVTPSDTPTATVTHTPSDTPTATLTASASPTETVTPSDTPTNTATPTNTLTSSPSPTASITPSETPEGFVSSVVPLSINASPTSVTIGVPTLPPTLPPNLTPTLTPQISPTPTAIPGDHIWFWRPFARDTSGRVSDAPARGYAYGSTGGGLQVHHGIDIENSTGTLIQSIGSGRVFYAGSDADVLFGPRHNFYGELVVIEHDYLAPNGQRLYSLYGHLSRVLAGAGEEVGFGTQVGAVGATGVAFGPHLHLEIRLGDPYDYNATLNPELWITPWENYGIFAARVIGPDGEPIKGLRVELIGRGDFIFGWTYQTDSVNPDPYYDENLVIGDIRSGQYDLKVGEIRNVLYRDVVFIQAGVVNFIEIRLDHLPEE